MDDMSQPLVTVVVLTYNNFDNIEKNIKSIQTQDYSAIELIVHDDGSKCFPKERILEVVKGKSERFTRYRIISNDKNVGTVKNYNLAIKEAGGEIIIPLSQDDCFYDSKAVSTIVDMFESTSCSICTGKRIGEKTREVYPRKEEEQFLKEDNNRRLVFRLMMGNFISGSTLYFRKNCFFNTESDAVFDERFKLLEDYPFVIDCAINSVKIEYIEELLVLYGESGVTGSNVPVSDTLKRDMLILHETRIIPWSQQLCSERLRCYFNYRYLRLQDSIDGTKKRALKLLLSKPRILPLIVKAKLKESTSPENSRFKYLYNLEYGK